MTDGLAAAAEATPIGRPKAAAKDLTAEMRKLTDALETVDQAVAELDVAVAKALRTKVPGMDLGANLADKLGPVLERIGFTTKALPKTRKAKT